MGVKALKLRDDDELATARVVAPDKDHVLVLTAAGYGKRVDVEAVRARSRATMGVQAIKFKKEGDVLVDVRGVADDDEVLVFVVLREPRTAPIAARPALSWRRARTFET